MRREGYELQIGQPQVIIKNIDGIKHEPVEQLTCDLPENVSGRVIEMVTKRKGTIEIPSRGIIGLRTQVITATAGEAIMTHRFLEYQAYKGEIPARLNGSLIALETGKAIPFSINNLQDRGKFFIPANVEIYEGQVIGENSRPNDFFIRRSIGIHSR